MCSPAYCAERDRMLRDLVMVARENAQLTVEMGRAAGPSNREIFRLLESRVCQTRREATSGWIQYRKHIEEHGC